MKSNLKRSYEEGGTRILTHTRSTAHTMEAGGDERKLGQWNWITLKGNNQQKTMIISNCRPHASQVNVKRQLAKIRRDIDGDVRELQPQLIWLQGLEKLAEKKLSKGNEVIIAINFNKKLNDEQGKIALMMQRLGLREVLLEMNGLGPNTHQRGSDLIDGIFASEGIQIRQRGYSNFEESTRDHQRFWIDIKETVSIGAGRDDRSPPILRKATPKIPSVRRDSNRILEEEVQKHELHEKMKKAMDYARKETALTPAELQELYEVVKERIKRAMKYADSKCRAIKQMLSHFQKNRKNSWERYEY